MSDSDEDNYIKYGTPLDPYEEDEVPSKRKFQQQPDQYAVDAHGRRRFHGAFTGGFSAGYGNTVGTPEGWTPSNFKSSRSEKALFTNQRPEDFMDEEDRGEFGIAPHQMQTQNDFSGQKRKAQRHYHDGPIPGEPVLTELVRAVHETAAVRMLKAMGWKEGQGTGNRVTSKEKKKAKEHHKVYGCYIPEDLRQERNPSEDSSDSEFDYETLFAPDDYEPYILSRKNDRFGLGYSGLSRHSVLGAMQGEYGASTSTSHLMMKEKGKKVSIRGQAFGVGAFEADDDDIYATEDMSHYDFAIGGPKDDKKQKKTNKQHCGGILEGFLKSTKPMPTVPSYPPPALPRDYTPAVAGTKRSRFEATDKPQRDQGLGRHELTAEARGQILGETTLQANKQSNHQTDKEDPISKLLGRNVNFVSQNENKQTNEILLKDKQVGDKSNLNSNDDFIPINSDVSKVFNPFSNANKVVSGKPKDNNEQMLSASSDLSKAIQQFSSVNNGASDIGGQDFISIKDSGNPIVKVFKPFKSDPKKQARYEMYLKDKNIAARDSGIDKLTEWERERELAEFEQAAKLYRPLSGIMGDRFTHASEPDDALNPLTAVARSSTNYGLATKDQIEAAKKGLYGILTRTERSWRPESLVCKRFNVPEPGLARQENKKEEKPKVSYSIFSYLETSVHDKDTFAKEQSKFSGSKSLHWDSKDLKPGTNKMDTTNKEIKNKLNETKTDVNKSVSNEETGFVKRMTTAELFLKESEKSKESGAEVTETINNFDRMTLYKSIFLSDSEDDEKNNDGDKTKSNIKDDNFIEIPKNVERNMSPPRGIFANIDFDELNSWRRKADEKVNIKHTTKDQNLNKDKIKDIKEKVDPEIDVEEVYGPKIPENLQKRLESSDKNESTNNLVHEIQSSSEDSWVDMNEVKEKKLKKKKSKKHKTKHKKSKHKKKDK